MTWSAMLHMICTLQISFWVLLEYNKLHYRGHTSLPVLTVQHEGALSWGGPLGASRCAMDMDAKAGNRFLWNLHQ